MDFFFLAGLSAGAPMAIGSGSVGDLFSERDRGSAMALYAIGLLLGTFFFLMALFQFTSVNRYRDY